MTRQTGTLWRANPPILKYYKSVNGFANPDGLTYVARSPTLPPSSYLVTERRSSTIPAFHFLLVCPHGIRLESFEKLSDPLFFNPFVHLYASYFPTFGMIDALLAE